MESALAVCSLAVLGAASVASVTAQPLACQPNAEQPMLPIFHIIGNVTKSSDGSIKLEPINDCSGVTYYEGIYHVWHQCCQNHWDHVISKDLVHWQRLPPPIQPVTLKTWDGSISMLPAADGGPIILYDAQDGKDAPWSGRNLSAPLDKPILGVARLADPTDKYLQTWTRVANNPVDFDGADAAFPGQIWKNGEYWNMIMQGDRYQSNDNTFHNWANKGAMIGKGEHGGQWWIPMPNQIGGKPPPAGVPNYLVNVGGGDQYLFGQYNANNETFVPWVKDGQTVMAHLEGGKGGWWGAQSANDRMMMIGWALGDYHGAAGPGIKVLTRLTLLREVNFDVKTMNLVSNPAPELVQLRGDILANEKAVALSAGKTYAVAGTEAGKAASADVLVTFSGFAATAATTFGACVLGDGTAGSGLGVHITVSAPAGTAGRTASVRVGACAETSAQLHSIKAARNITVERMMPNTNFPHGDLFTKEFPPATPATACEALCDKTAACEAWTYLMRGKVKGSMSCCIKGPISGIDGCPAPAKGMTSGAKVAGTTTCGGAGPGPRPPAPSTGVPLFDETSLTLRILPDRSLADFFVQGGRWSGTVAWESKDPRAAADSQVTVWSSTAGVKADVDAYSMGCGWATPSYTEHPTM